MNTKVSQKKHRPCPPKHAVQMSEERLRKREMNSTLPMEKWNAVEVRHGTCLGALCGMKGFLQSPCQSCAVQGSWEEHFHYGNPSHLMFSL